MPKTIRASLILLLTLCLGLGILADTKQTDSKKFVPKISKASDQGEQAIQTFRIPKGIQVELFAAEPLLANPVAFCIDEKGRFYVAETFRLHQGVTDIRGHMDWLDDDLASRTVEDRVKVLKKYLGKDFPTYEVAHDQIRLISDTDNDGKADAASVFADGFNNAADGIGAGVLARRGEVWYTCIPDLWYLKDQNGDGKSDVRKSLQYGYGIHTGYLGHDLHGLKLGPDGKLYFSIGDRGLHVKTKDGVVSNPDTGAVLRCNPDGSELEVFATGLRNPQELAFDNYGNLFTGDNNSDSGDKARWVYLVEGGDSGWRIGYQFIKSPVARGPWNSERMWWPQNDGQPAFLVPPIINLGDGPSGLVHYPGTGMSKRYDNHFFLCDFRGGPGRSGIRSFAVKPKGATFELIDSHQFLWLCLPTDVDFGFDGSMYFTDWVNGWRKPTKGRIYRVTDPVEVKKPVVKEVQQLFAKGIHTLSTEKLVKLLEHQDQRVRQEAQFSLAEKQEKSVEVLIKVATKGKHQLARLHAIWGLGQIARKHRDAGIRLIPLLKDDDEQVRSQAAKVLGDLGEDKAFDQMVKLLEDDSDRVIFFAAQALGKMDSKEAVDPLLQMLEDNADQDAYLRHAGALALARIGSEGSLKEAATHESPSVRMASLLAMRRLKQKDITAFLHDANHDVMAEAARAIYDVPIPEAMGELAALLDRSTKSESTLQKLLATSKDPEGARKWIEPVLYRALNANFRIGNLKSAQAVADLATRSNVPLPLRVEAMKLLREWSKPSGRDHIVGLWRPLKPRDAAIASEGLRASLGKILTGPDQLRREAIRTAASLGIKDIGPTLFEILKDRKRPAEVRAESLRALNALNDRRLKDAINLARDESEPEIRHEGRVALARVNPKEAVPLLAKILKKGDPLLKRITREEQDAADHFAQQGAFAILGTMKAPAATKVLEEWMQLLSAGKVPPRLQLDVINAIETSKSQALKKKLSDYENGKPKDDPLAKYSESLVGGDAERGREIFFFKTAVSCVRCHRADNVGGEVGPNLGDVGLRQKRRYLLESIVKPNAQIAKGFETTVIRTRNGQSLSGIIKDQNREVIRLMTAEGKLLTVKKENVEKQMKGQSAMPEDAIKQLSRTELRDLVEYLSTLKKKP